LFIDSVPVSNKFQQSHNALTVKLKADLWCLNTSITKGINHNGNLAAERFPTGRPWSITYTANDWILDGVLSLNTLSDSLAMLEEKLLALEHANRSTGTSIELGN
jgi:hypothetical protein